MGRLQMLLALAKDDARRIRHGLEKETGLKSVAVNKDLRALVKSCWVSHTVASSQTIDLTVI